ncbi:MAG: aromatic acid exporter family protein [Actinomycetota bacterium]
MRVRIDQLGQQFVVRWYWIQQVLVTSIAAAIAWQVGDSVLKHGGLVAAIVATLTVRSSLHKSTREGVGQVVGSSVGAGAALLALHFFGLGVVTVGITVLLSLVAARILHLGEVAAINVPVTALIVIGPGLSETNASNRLISTIIGAVIAIALSTFAHPKTPAGRTIDRVSSLTDRCAALLAQMAKGLNDGYSLDEAGRWLARARLLAEEIPSIRNQVIEARVFAKWLPASRTENAEKLYLRGIAVEHMIVQVRATARILYDLRLNGGIGSDLSRGIGGMLSTTSYALAVSAEDFRFDPYSGVKDPLTAEIRNSANALTGVALADSAEIARGQIARVMGVISSTIIIADSLDQISPAIRNVPTPEGPSSQQILAVSPLEQARTWQNRLYRLIPERIRSFLERG